MQELYESRYGPGWQNLAARTKALQGGKCACCGNVFPSSALQVHHVRYSDTSGMLGDRAVPGIDVFAVCGSKQDVGSCHHKLHAPGIWLVDPINPALGNRNAPEIIQSLKRNFQGLTWREDGARFSVYQPQLSEERTPSDRFSRRLNTLQDGWEALKLEARPRENWMRTAIDQSASLGFLSLLLVLFILLL